ncbi:MAG: hypothetical protein K2Q25_00300 [Mycobacteriaceae bacterium]|nr:hypothetical protein [Mycobacteriaceae bacterium]
MAGVLPIPPARPLSPVILTPDVWPTGRPAMEAALETWVAKRDKTAAELAVCRAAMTQIQSSAQSNGFDAMYEKYCDNYGKLAGQLDRIDAIVDVQTRSIRETAALERHLENLDWRAHEEIARRKLPLTSPAALAIASQANADARLASSSTGETIAVWAADFTGKYGPPTDVTATKPASFGSRHDLADDHANDSGGSADSPRPRLGNRGDEAGTSNASKDSPTLGQRGELDTGAPVVQPPLISGLPGSGISGGGGLPSGGLPGLGSGNPLSGLMSGLGQVTQSSAGLSGLPSTGAPSAAAQAAQVGQPFASGLAAGANSGSLLPAAPKVAPPIEAGSLPPAASVASASATAATAGIAAAGAHSPVSVGESPSGGLSASASAPSMLLPSSGMGAPAAPGVPSGTAPGGPGAGSVAAVSGGAPASSVAPAGESSAGPTLVPASVVASAAGTGRTERTVSPDVAAANALAWELQAACDKRGYPLSWAVGVFRSPAGSETVVMSNDGSGYVPPGVFLPRNVRLLVADSLVDKAFRDRWFGWADPALVLVEYAGLRVHTEWKLVAAAANDSVAAFRGTGVDHGEPCKRERCRLAQDWSPPVLDELHVHRLQLEYPDLYDRLQRLATIEPNLQERVILPLSGRLVNSLKSVVGVDVPPILRAVWTTLTAGNEPTPAVWEQYDTENVVFAVLSAAHRPGGFDNGPQRPEDVPFGNGEFYRNQWFVARTLEHIGGWSTRPLPLADMAYAAAAIGTADLREQLEPSLREIEDELRGS